MGTTTKKRMKAKGVDDVANALTPILLLGKEDAHRLYADSLTRFLTESGLMKGKGERYMKPGGDTWKKRCSENTNKDWNKNKEERNKNKKWWNKDWNKNKKWWNKKNKNKEEENTNKDWNKNKEENKENKK